MYIVEVHFATGGSSVVLSTVSGLFAGGHTPIDHVLGRVAFGLFPTAPTCCQARGLAAMDKGGTSDPYVQVLPACMRALFHPLPIAVYCTTPDSA
jgi:hypothetical protein